MKKNIQMLKITTCLVLAIAMLHPGSYATIHEITVGGASNTFAPSSLTVNPGDTLRWIGAGGFHTTTSQTIPPGAAAWNETINAMGVTFDYVPTEIGTYDYVCIPHSPGMNGTFTVTVPTPVKMGTLVADISAHNQIRLTWSTYQEVDNHHFDMQRSGDGRAFISIATIPSQAAGGNSSSLLQYQYLDKSLLEGRAYYRLLQQNTDGQTSYSNVAFIALKGGRDLQLHLHPNPAEGKVHIHIAGLIGNHAHIQLQTIDGRVIRKAIPAADNTEMTIFDLKGIAAGSYLIKYADDYQTVTEQLTIK